MSGAVTSSAGPPDGVPFRGADVAFRRRTHGYVSGATLAALSSEVTQTGRAMDHDAETLIDRAIANTRTYLRAPGGDQRVARAGLERIRADVLARAPDSPALARLSDFIAEIERRLNQETGAGVVGAIRSTRIP